MLNVLEIFNSEWMINQSFSTTVACCLWLENHPSLKTSFTKAWLCHLQIYTNILPLLWKPLPAFICHNCGFISRNCNFISHNCNFMCHTVTLLLFPKWYLSFLGVISITHFIFYSKAETGCYILNILTSIVFLQH